MTDIAVRTTGLNQGLQGHPVQKGVDLAVPGGEIFALVGSNGAVKATTVKCLGRTAEPDGVSVSVGGFDAAGHPDQVR